ncbi:MAG: EAL domain-containing protein [Desulfuromonadaceae bacterium]|nr:EAL domain-containing protein [Desulfuromonadaceae bacterium]
MMCEKKVSILTVEDEVDFRKSIVAYLQDSGFEVFEAGNGQDGLEVMRQREPDLVLTDLKMPEMDGVTFIEQARKINPERPLVVISGEGLATEAVRAVRAGAWDYITKPITDFALLENCLRSVLEKAEQIKREKQAKQGLEVLVEKQNQQLVEMTRFDPVTNLPLRSEFVEQADLALRDAGKMEAWFVVMGLDNMTAIGDAFGHHVATIAMKGFVSLIKKQLPSSALIGKLYDDQIALLLHDESCFKSILGFLQNLTQETFVVAGHDLPINVSIGVSLSISEEVSARKLLSRASLAQYKARQTGRNQVVFYSEEIETESLKRLLMESSLRRALANREFLLHYQPQIDTKNQKVVGCEALLRWQSPTREALVSPFEFIPVLEDTGLIEQVGAWCLEEACRQYMQWQQMGLAPIRLSVNVSAQQFHSGNFLEIVRRALHATGMKAECLCLELTESIVMKNINQTLGILNELSQMNIKLSLDDFGTGYSSLQYLHQMNLSELKIDKSFVDGLPHNPTSISIIETILGMACAMNLEVVAEGVENEEQLAFITASGCQAVQGFYYSRPLPPEQFFSFSQQN